MAKSPPATPLETWEKLATLGLRAQRAMLETWRCQAQSDGFVIPDPMVVASAFAKLAAAVLTNPWTASVASLGLAHDLSRLWQQAARRVMGETAEPVAVPAKDDKRFLDEAWSEEGVFDVLKQSYLIAARRMAEVVRDVDGIDPKTRQQVAFYTRQWADALSPSNYLLTNPQILRATVEANGANLIRGFEKLVRDWERGRDRLAIAMTDADAFRLGENIATTAGKVVAQNDLMQLLQYEPATSTVHQRPILIVPPWINKYYILDLRPRNSFIKWLVDQGFTVFCISWVNPGEALAHKGFDDYLREGPLAALDLIGAATGESEVNLVGYCIGGTLTACAAAHLAARGDDRVKSATFLTALVDFSEPGELGVFIDDLQLDLLERHLARKGYLESRHMATVFNMMRDNDLIWSFVVNNYLLGRDPPAFDLLFWNADSTRMPAMMHRFYLRRMYQENRLVEPGGITLLGTPIDLGRVTIPVYLLATREDHIAPWRSAYAGVGRYGGPATFVLSSSGHIAGVVNPPASRKYGHWTNPQNPAAPALWLDGATRQEGSWWPHWRDWAMAHAGPPVAARRPGEGSLGVLEDAPGTYVKMRGAD